MTKNEREEREYKSLFSDERFAKKAWKEFIGTSLSGDAKALPTIYDAKSKEPTLQSVIDTEAYNNVKKRLEANGLERQPMQAELIVESNILRARFTDTTFTTILDRTAGKVKDEISISGGEYEDLTDEEIEVLLALREKNKQKKGEAE